MSNLITGKGRSRFLRIFIPVTALTTVCVLIITFLISVTYISNREKSIAEQYELSLTMVSSLYQQMRMNTMPTLNALFETKEIQDYLFCNSGHDQDGKYETFVKVGALIDRTVARNGYIHSIYLYNGVFGYFSSYAGYEGVTCYSDKNLDSFLEQMGQRPVTFTMRTTSFFSRADYTNTDESKEENLYTMTISHKTNNAAKSYALVVNLSESNARELFTQKTGEMKPSFFITDYRRYFLSHPDPSFFNTPVKPFSIYDRICSLPVEKGKSGGYVKLSSEGEKYFVCYEDQPTMGWRLFYIIPYSQLMHGFYTFIKNIIFVTLVVFFAAVIAIIIVSQKVDLSLSYERRLLSYVQGKLNKVELPVSKVYEYGVAIFRITPKKLKLMSTVDRGELQKNIYVSAAGYLQKKGQLISLDDLLFLWLSSLNPNGIYVKLCGFTDVVKQRFDADITAVVAEATVNMSDLPQEVSHLKETMKEQYLINRGSVDYASRRYPEMTVINIHEFETALVNKDDKQFMLYMEKAIAAMKENPSWFSFNLFITNLVYILNQYLHNEINLYLSGGMTALSEDISTLEEIQGLTEISERIRRVLLQSREAGKSSKNLEIVTVINRYIKGNIKNTMLNSDMIADYVGLSLNYTRSIYRQTTGKSFNDVIGEERLALAVDLLTRTDKTIDEVRREAGFANYSYFCTYFKNKFGVSPTYYRIFRNKTKK
ncbi:helix-turn-helix domain-containing protein [Treponema parvum]|uniref:helix-turn-helix domain-containing protein n=1 Tax=Treponema parvum TaxID=138851 RepID=UPI001AEBE93E|nr:helix-turn-helix domain-containing protein [Treponema parvum]QTQ17100.1 AraC family transcriptional regulator [Treponema parvum]